MYFNLCNHNYISIPTNDKKAIMCMWAGKDSCWNLSTSFSVFFSRPTPIGGREIHIG